MMKLNFAKNASGSRKMTKTKIGPFTIPTQTALVLWVIGLIIGCLYSADFQTRPATAALTSIDATPRLFPDSTQLSRDADRPIIVMFVHPFCSCSRASLVEFAKALASTNRDFKAYVVFYSTERLPTPVEQSDLWKQAIRIPQVIVERDPDGVIARSFGAITSGSVVTYDSDGHLTFVGGITQSRGHIGRSHGGTAIVDRLRHDRRSCESCPVFGCPLTKKLAKEERPHAAAEKK